MEPIKKTNEYYEWRSEYSKRTIISSNLSDIANKLYKLGVYIGEIRGTELIDVLGSDAITIYNLLESAYTNLCMASKMIKD